MKRPWLAAAAATGAVLLFVSEQLQATRLGFEVERTRHLVQEASRRNAYLRLDLERRLSPSELAALAHARLGMAPPTPDALVLLARAGERPIAAPEPTLVAMAPAPERIQDGRGSPWDLLAWWR